MKKKKVVIKGIHRTAMYIPVRYIACIINGTERRINIKVCKEKSHRLDADNEFCFGCGKWMD